MTKKVNDVLVGSSVKILKHEGFMKITDKRYNGYPRDENGCSYMVTLQSGPHHVTFNKNDLVTVL